jgi:hypothetical protein
MRSLDMGCSLQALHGIERTAGDGEPLPEALAAKIAIATANARKGSARLSLGIARGGKSSVGGEKIYVAIVADMGHSPLQRFSSLS